MDLPQLAAAGAFPRCDSVREAVDRLGFVQAHPLRAPARADRRRPRWFRREREAEAERLAAFLDLPVGRVRA